MIEKRFDDDTSHAEYYTTYENDSIKSITNIDYAYGKEKKLWFMVDSLYYDANNRLIRKEIKRSDENGTRVTKFYYNDSGLLSMTVDTTINLGPQNVVKDRRIDSDKKILVLDEITFSAYSNKTEYNYNSDGKLIEMIMYQPDYKTPCCKYTYEYIINTNN